MKRTLCTLAGIALFAACGGDDGSTTPGDDAAVDAPAGPPTLTIAATASIGEGDAGSAAGQVAVTLSRAATEPVTVAFATTDGTALAATDYTDASGTLTFAAGETTKHITLEVDGDTLDEDDERFTVTLSAPSGAPLGAQTSATITVTDDDAPPRIAAADLTAAEGAGLTFTVNLSAASGKPVMVNFATSDGTAVAPGDYLTTSGTLTFAPGQTSQTVPVAVVNDTADEADETITFVLAMPTNATLATVVSTATITDDDAPPTIAIDDATVAEGNAGAATLSFPVTLSTASGRAVSVMYATTAGTATAGTDYLTASGTLDLAAGQTTGMINVTVNGEVQAEPDETFTVTLANPTDATLVDPPTATGTILNDDGNAPTLVIDDVALVEGNTGTTNMTFTVTLSAASAANVTVNYATANNTATDAPGVGGSDYAPTSGILTFTPGQLTRPVVVQVVGDINDEANESFRVNLSTATNAIIADAQAIGTIDDDDATPTLSGAPVTVTESTATATFTVTLSAAAGRTVTVNYATVDAIALSTGSIQFGGEDFVARSGTLTYLPGETSKSIAISINADPLDEADENFVLRLTGAVNATVPDWSVICFITDDDPTPTVSIADLATVEGTGGSSTAAAPVTLSARSGRIVTVDFTTAMGQLPRAIAGEDYAQTSGTLTFTVGQTSKLVNVPLVADAVDEVFENFVINLSNPVNATIADGSGAVTIVNDDSLLPNMSISNAVNVTEGAANNMMTFAVTLSSAAAQAITVDYATAAAAGTATPGADYTATAGTLTFAPGQTTRTIAVPVLADNLNERTETVFVSLSGNSANSNLLDAQGQGNIVDDDPIPTVSVSHVVLVEGNTGTANLTFTVGLSAFSGQEVRVSYATVDGTASSADGLGLNDYEPRGGVLTFAAGELTQTVVVPINGDAILEPNEVFRFTLSNPVNVELGAATATGTIINDDAQPTLVIAGLPLPEGPAGVLTPMGFRITLSAPSLTDVTVTFATANGTAIGGPDFLPQPASPFTIPAGSIIVIRNVIVLGDNVPEASETFTGNLANAVNAIIGTASATMTIVNDD